MALCRQLLNWLVGLLIGAMLLYGIECNFKVHPSQLYEKKQQKFDLILILHTKFGCSGAVHNCETIGGLD